MDEYISKQKVLDYLTGYLHSLGYGNTELLANGQRKALINAIQDISAVKAADVQPVKRAKWDFQGYQLFKCTNCKEIFTQDQLEAMQNHRDCEECAFPNYCPNCGARMDGDNNA